MDTDISETSKYDFTNTWFVDAAKRIWDELIPQVDPTKVLEIGCYEGACTCYLIDKLAERKNIEVHCVDSWTGGVEHRNQSIDMSKVRTRFFENTRLSIESVSHEVNLVVHEGASKDILAKLVCDGKHSFFDLIYIDGSHQASDVIIDAVLSFQLLRIGGVMIFDDYLWSQTYTNNIDLLDCPKIAIDAFTCLFRRQTRYISAPLSQIYLQKIAN